MAKRTGQHPQARFRTKKASSGGDHQHKRKSKWAEVTCPIHGKEMAAATWKPKQVRVPIAKTRKQRTSGCPLCNNEKGQKP